MDRNRHHYRDRSRDRNERRSGSHRRPQSPGRRSFSPHRRNYRPTQRQEADQRWNTNNEGLIQSLVEHEKFAALTLNDLSLRDVTRPSREAYVFPSLPKNAVLHEARHGFHNPDVLERISTTATPSLNWVTEADKKGEYLIKGTMNDHGLDNLTNTLKDLALKNGGVCYNMKVQFLSVSNAREHHDQVDQSWQQAQQAHQRLTDQDHARSRAATRSVSPPYWREEDELRGRAVTRSTLPPPRREDEPRGRTPPAAVKMKDAPPATRSVLPPHWREEDEPRGRAVTRSVSPPPRREDEPRGRAPPAVVKTQDDSVPQDAQLERPGEPENTTVSIKQLLDDLQEIGAKWNYNELTLAELMGHLSILWTNNEARAHWQDFLRSGHQGFFCFYNLVRSGYGPSSRCKKYVKCSRDNQDMPPCLHLDVRGTASERRTGFNIPTDDVDYYEWND